MRFARFLGLAIVIGINMGRGATQAADPGPPSPDEERAALRLADPSLTIELVAAEPLVQSPVAIAWDEAGRLYVAEMVDYPVAPPAGRVKRLEDRDDDGRYEHATTFADGLPYPNGVLPWNGGVLVTAAPDIWFFKDNNGDGVADEKRVILTGFAEGNQQLRVNGLTWGLDNWVYAANGRSGGAIRRPGDPAEQAIPIPRNDIRFRPGSGEVEALAGFSQFGLPRDDWGNRFPSWNTAPIRHVVLEARELARNPHLSDAATTANILDPADNGRIFSLAPPPLTFNAEPVAFFNASCGPAIYRGDLLPEPYRGNAFVCEPLTSLVHRRNLVPDGPTFVAKRVEPGEEFLASSHPWFRPVNLTTGPEGALYVVDFCRAMVEHPAFVPRGKGEGVDFRRGHEFGRIWRVRSTNAQRPGRVTLDPEDAHKLVAALDHPNGWVRDTAQRLLVERRHLAAVAELEALARKGPNPLGQIHALATLSGLGALRVETLRTALADPHPRVREQALRCIEDQGIAASYSADLPRLADDRDARVRFRSAISLGSIDTPEARAALVRIASRDSDDRWIRLAVLSGLGRSAGAFLDAVIADAPAWLDRPTSGQARLLEQLGETLGAQGADREHGEALRNLAIQKPKGIGTYALFSGLAARGRGVAPEVVFLLDEAADVAGDGSGPLGRRVWAARLMARGSSPALATLLEPGVVQEVQSEAVRGVSTQGGVGLAKRSVENWLKLPRTTRRELLSELTRTTALAEVLMDAIENEQVPLAELDPATREALRRLPDVSVRRRIVDLLNNAEPVADRGEVLRTFQAAIQLDGDPARGGEVFERNCLTCHQRGDQGHRVGPDLTSVAGRAKETLLSDILDPNREVAPDHMNFVVVTTGGQVLGGLIAEETPGGVKLRRAEGVEETVPRGEIAELRATGQSLMPVGLEQSLSAQDIADLIALLRRGLGATTP
jgi:putative membrane-bound dehydrogenase-like protein